MNISDLELDVVRNQYDVDIFGNIEKVTIFNLLGEDRENIKKMLGGNIENGLEGNELVESVFTEVFELCTDLTLDKNVIEVINKPKLDMIKILQDVKEIVQEVIIETLLERVDMISQLEIASYTQLMILKSEKVNIINKQCKQLEKDIEELKNLGD